MLGGIESDERSLLLLDLGMEEREAQLPLSHPLRTQRTRGSREMKGLHDGVFTKGIRGRGDSEVVWCAYRNTFLIICGDLMDDLGLVRRRRLLQLTAQVLREREREVRMSALARKQGGL
jgi:heme exporter protein D